jgi:hypothetical protein
MWDLVAENYISANSSEQPTASTFRINDSSIIKIEAVGSSVKILRICQNKRRHPPEDRAALFTPIITYVYTAVK